MTRVIEVRLKDKTTDEYVDVEPDTDRAGRLVDGIRHQHQLNDNGSLSVFREIYTAPLQPLLAGLPGHGSAGGELGRPLRAWPIHKLS